LVVRQAPHTPLRHVSGAHSASVVHVLWQVPCVAPTHVCEVAHCSFAEQPQLPLVHTPLTQSAPVTQPFTTHEPLHVLPDPQSAFDEQTLALHVALRHRPCPLAPQSAFDPHDAGGVHAAPLQVMPAGHWLSLLHVDRLHLAPLQRLLLPHAASLAQVARPHVAPLQVWLVVQSVSAEQAAALLHLAPVHCWLFLQSVSCAQGAGLPHFAPLQDWLFVQSVSCEHPLGVAHLAPLQT
jgi:hypothetical protein